MNIQLLALDVDGVLTDGKLIYGSDGQELKAFNSLDGLGLTAFRQTGGKLAIITGRQSVLVERRAKELRVDCLSMACKNKTQALKDICEHLQIPLEAVAYMGDDLNDLGPLQLAGLALAPANACDDVKLLAHYVTQRPGGHGAVREVVEYILKRENKWDAVLDSYRNETYQVGQ